ncbi:DsbA family protein [Candidatus Pelagibacter sp.]|nr:DsbA family protein [Candidatus Pelagibacter sp.]|tara:strand:- start:392 stop:976 length:585 start_codon:yes stop_codon:yes gene_type:complete
MTKSLDFYFDFISPYSFIAHKKIEKIRKKKIININYKPILLGGLHNLGGITAPAFNERKMKNMKNDCVLISLKNDIDFIWNSKFPINSLYLMRGYLAIDEKVKKNFFNRCFDAYWKENIDISLEKNVINILNSCGLNKNVYFEDIKKQEIKDKLKNYTNNAFQKDIFGAPTFVVNNKIFWGQDRLEYALDEYNL